MKVQIELNHDNLLDITMQLIKETLVRNEGYISTHPDDKEQKQITKACKILLKYYKRQI